MEINSFCFVVLMNYSLHRLKHLAMRLLYCFDLHLMGYRTLTYFDPGEEPECQSF